MACVYPGGCVYMCEEGGWGLPVGYEIPGKLRIPSKNWIEIYLVRSIRPEGEMRESHNVTVLYEWRG